MRTKSEPQLLPLSMMSHLYDLSLNSKIWGLRVVRCENPLRFPSFLR